jgi:NAD(P)-dependent dehydrogenase (short-subunit alcohol dehydrogenase family)
MAKLLDHSEAIIRGDAPPPPIARLIGFDLISVKPGEGGCWAGIIGSDFEKQMVSNTPLGRLGQPEDIARVAVFLASDDAEWVTGERITVSGGLH